MKKITITAIAALCLLAANAQGTGIAHSGFKPIKDTAVKPPEVTANTPLLTIADLNRVDSLLQRRFDVSQLKNYQEIVQFMQTLVNGRIQEFTKQSAIKPSAKKP